MAITDFGTNDPLAVNLWSKSIDVEALKHRDIFPLTGDDANSVIHRKPKTSTPQGERFSAPQAAIRAELIADDSCSALGMTVRGFAPALALCRLLVEAGHDPATPLEAWRGAPIERIRRQGTSRPPRHSERVSNPTLIMLPDDGAGGLQPLALPPPGCCSARGYSPCTHNMGK